MARVDKVVTSGTFSLDGGTWEVDNNVWVIGDDRDCVVIDAAHDATAILGAVGDRTVTAILCTHAHDDHIDALAALVGATGAPSYVHPGDTPLWTMTYDEPPDHELADGQQIEAGGSTLTVLHTPGHSPGACCFYAEGLRSVFSGDTLFAGGPGATGRSYSDFGTIVASIQDKLLTLPPTTTVHTGHGDDTTIGDESPHVQDWLDRGH